MNSNSKLLHCILGSLILTLLNNPILVSARLGIFENSHGITMAVIYQAYNLFFNILSFIGLVLLIVFSIKLIINNIKKDK